MANYSRCVRNAGVPVVVTGRKMTYHIDKEPVFIVDSVCVEEEGSPDEALRKEVGS